MKLRELEAALQEVDGFEDPKVHLEQYATTSHLAAHMLYTADNSFGDINGKLVCDLGCGCGMLTVGCALLDSSFVVGMDIDPDAIAIAQRNVSDFDLTASVDLVLGDAVTERDSSVWALRHAARKFDTVVLNPPFGTKSNKGIDMVFLQRALDLSAHAVYSLHKTATRDHILKKAREWGVSCQVVAELRYDLQASYKFHKKRSVDIEVDLLRFERRSRR